jgi:hypothetical protein
MALPRKMDLVRLVDVLVGEHIQIRESLVRVKESTAKGDFGSASAELKRVDCVFKRHIEDEESTILRMLIGELGVEGAKEEIRVFQQHRPIYNLMQKVARFASLPAGELVASQDELKALLEEHTRAEEERVFPRALAVG